MTASVYRARPVQSIGGPAREAKQYASGVLFGLVWVYVFLLIFEGALRKWIVPSLSGPVLFARDPVVLAIYVFAAQENLFAWKASSTIMAILAVIGVMIGFATNPEHVLVTVYGFKANFFHVPLIFVIGRALSAEQAIKLGRLILWCGIAMLPVVVQQFRSSPDSIWNVGAGGVSGGQLFGAAGKVRASGFFSFVSGLAQFCSIFAAFILYGFLKPKTYNKLLLMAATGSLVMILAVSTSCTAIGNVATVMLTVLVIAFFNKAALGRIWIAIALIGFVFFVVSSLDLFKEGTEVLSERLTTTGDLNAGVVGASKSLGGRIGGDLWSGVEAMTYAPLFGYGIGIGTNAGAQLTTGKLGFLLAEGEWARIVLEMGPLFGAAYLLTRIGMLLGLLKESLSAVKLGNALALLLFGSAFWELLTGQFGQATAVGFAIVSSGLCLAACNDAPDQVAVEEPEVPKVRSRSRYAEYLYGSVKK